MDVFETLPSAHSAAWSQMSTGADRHQTKRSRWLRYWLAAVLLSLLAAPVEAGLSAIYTFIAAGGLSPRAPLVLGPDGTFYGTTTSGGANGYGTVFKLTRNGTPATLVSFNNTNGANPAAGL